MENKEITELTLDDGSVFLVLAQEEIDGHLYLYLVNVNDHDDVMINEYKDNELLGINDETFDKLIEIFQNKHKN